METKPWYQSKTIWFGIIGVIIAAYDSLHANVFPTLPVIPAWILGILASLGIYGRVSATTAIK